MAEIRRADAVWQGDLVSGSGTITASSSNAFSALPITWASRSEAPQGRTSPEELVAAAHASCFSMAFSASLARAGHAPERLEVSAAVTFDRVEGGFAVVSSALTVRGKVPGIDAATFKNEAEAAKDTCPISRALQNNVKLSVEATLEP